MATLDLDFTAPPPPAELAARVHGEAHVWRIDLEQPAAYLLSYEEQARADAMRHEGTRRSFSAARSALRRILAHYVPRDARDLPIALDAKGKPFLSMANAPLFNLSHSHGKALVAVATVPVGIDLEFGRSLRQVDRLVASYFSAAEAAAMAALPEDLRERAFLAGWTRKEAFLKATGEGLAGGLASFDVTLHPDEDARLLAIAGDREAAARWTLHAFAPFPGSQAAICLAGQEIPLRGFHFGPQPG